MVLHVVVALFYSFVALYLKGSTSVHKRIFLIPWICFNGVFVIAYSLSQVQLKKSGKSVDPVCSLPKKVV